MIGALCMGTKSVVIEYSNMSICWGAEITVANSFNVCPMGPYNGA